MILAPKPMMVDKESIKEVKTVLKTSAHADEVWEMDDNLSEDFFAKLHDKVMAAVEKTEIEETPSRKRDRLQEHHRLWRWQSAVATANAIVGNYWFRRTAVTAGSRSNS